MAHKELIKELIQRKSSLVVELEAIEALIKVYDVVTTTTTNTTTNTSTNNTIEEDKVKPIDRFKDARDTSGTGVPKGDMGWRDYSLYLLKELGSGKASQIIKLAILANPKIEESTIKNAITSKLSKLYTAKTIEATVPVNKKEGYVYRIKTESNDSE